jgi:PAS domain S-box-containing protein
LSGTGIPLDEATPLGLGVTIEQIRRIAPAATATAHDLVCAHDLDGRILFVNDSVCEATGLPAATLCSMTIQDLLPSESASGFAAYVDRLKRDGCADGIMKVVRRDGGRRFWEYSNTLDADAMPAPIARGVARDVTEREEAFQAVRRSEEHFRSIIENTSDVVAVVELDGRIRYESPSVERVLGYPRNVLVGTPFVDLIHRTMPIGRPRSWPVRSPIRPRSRASNCGPAITAVRGDHSRSWPTIWSRNGTPRPS